MYACMYVRMYVCMYVRMYVCMYVRMYVCMYVCMYACMYIYMYICTLCISMYMYTNAWARYVCKHGYVFVCYKNNCLPVQISSMVHQVGSDCSCQRGQC